MARTSAAGARWTRQLAARQRQRLANDLQAELASGLARRLTTVSDQRIEELMVTPLRRVLLDAVFWGLPHVLTGSHAHELASSVRFHLSGRPDGGLDAYWLEFRDGRWHGGRGQREVAQLTITVAAVDLLALARGRANPLREYVRGRLRVNGNPIAAARLLSLTRELLAASPDDQGVASERRPAREPADARAGA